MRLKHYSSRTEEIHVDCIRRFIVFRGRRHPDQLGAQHVENFLTHLAVEGDVARQPPGGEDEVLVVADRPLHAGVVRVVHEEDPAVTLGVVPQVADGAVEPRADPPDQAEVQLAVVLVEEVHVTRPQRGGARLQGLVHGPQVLPVQPGEPGETREQMQALIEGTLVLRKACVRLQSTFGAPEYLLVWPPGFTARDLDFTSVS